MQGVAKNQYECEGDSDGRQVLSWIVRALAVVLFSLGLLLLIPAAFFEPSGESATSLARWLLDFVPGVCVDPTKVGCETPLSVTNQHAIVLAILLLAVTVALLIADRYLLTRKTDEREAAREAFDAVRLEKGKIEDALNELRTTAANRYMADYNWYDRAANLRRIASWAIRASAVILLGLGLIMLDLAAFDPGGKVAKSMAGWLIDLLPGVCVIEGIEQEGVSNCAEIGNQHTALVATVLVAVAGIVLMYDRYMLIHRNFVAYRLTEYRLRSMQAEFLAEFDKARLARPVTKDNEEKVFVEFKALATRLYATAAQEIETETRAWGQILEQAIERLRTQAESAAQSAKQATEEAEAAARPGRLKVTVDSKHDNTKDYTIELQQVGSDKPKCRLAKPGQKHGFPLPPGDWEVRLKQVTEIIGSDVISLDANSDREVTL